VGPAVKKKKAKQVQYNIVGEKKGRQRPRGDLASSIDKKGWREREISPIALPGLGLGMCPQRGCVGEGRKIKTKIGGTAASQSKGPEHAGGEKLLRLATLRGGKAKKTDCDSGKASLPECLRAERGGKGI